jgi:ribonuclease VapC
MSDCVLDASALLAILNQEPVSEALTKAVATSAISAVNFSEVVAKLTDASLNEGAVREALAPLGLDVVPFDHELALLAGFLRAQTRGFGLSLGDRACLALGKRMGLPIFAADREWARLRLGLDIRVIR